VDSDPSISGEREEGSGEGDVVVVVVVVIYETGTEDWALVEVVEVGR